MQCPSVGFCVSSSFSFFFFFFFCTVASFTCFSLLRNPESLDCIHLFAEILYRREIERDKHIWVLLRTQFFPSHGKQVYLDILFPSLVFSVYNVGDFLFIFVSWITTTSLSRKMLVTSWMDVVLCWSCRRNNAQCLVRQWQVMADGCIQSSGN